MLTSALSGCAVLDGDGTHRSEALQVGPALACFNRWIQEKGREIKAVGRRAIDSPPPGLSIG